MKTLSLLTCFFVLAAACSKDDDHDGCGCGNGHDHAHKAPHGGDLIALGDHEAHAEFKLDHDAGTLTVWTYDDEIAIKNADEAPTLRMKQGNETLSLTSKGSANEWVFTHDAFKSEPGKIRFRISIGGTKFTPDWTHEHHGHDDDGGHDDHDHDHDHDHDGDHDHDDHDDDGGGHDHDD